MTLAMVTGRHTRGPRFSKAGIGPLQIASQLLAIDKMKGTASGPSGVSVRPQTANLPDIGVAQKFNPRDIIHIPAVKFFVRLDLSQICLFLDGHELDGR